jgi:lipoprotein-anchoring transpeptidase ErfK/SrfK
VLYLYTGYGDSLLRIHGTPQPWSIGMSASSGCIRMVNDHVIQLYDMVDVGTPVRLHPV